ncbi:ABC transporter ATP-binding protein, partial [Staphylococcus capitis]|uniref:ABC transporter ATP-binding protein n=1 Tax=Staphylococcus capitis TaxID=29388 RepID=UPI003D02272B
MTDAVVEVRDLTMTYGNQNVVDGLDLTLRRGQIFALLGPNGAGKTTTIEVLEGFRRRTSGEVAVLGSDPERGGEPWRQRIGIVLQSSRDHALWRVKDLLAHVASFYADPFGVRDLLQQLGMTGYADRRCGELSGGQRRRFDVAMGIVGRPELLFLDEPTTGIDPAARGALHDLVLDLRRGGVTIVLTTHDLHEAEKLADDIGVMSAGRIVARGSVAQLATLGGSGALVRWEE